MIKRLTEWLVRLCGYQICEAQFIPPPTIEEIRQAYEDGYDKKSDINFKPSGPFAKEQLSKAYINEYIRNKTRVAKSVTLSTKRASIR